MMLDNGQHKKYTLGDVIYEEGQMLERFPIYFLLEGEIEIVKRYIPLKTEKFTIQKGQVFGLLEVYGGVARQTTARVTAHCQLVQLTVSDFEENMKNHLNLALLAVKNLSSMLRILNQRVKDIK